MIDLNLCSGDRLSDLQLCHRFLSELPHLIAMTPITEVEVFWYTGDPDPDEHGITGNVIIAESHITIHTYPHKQFAFIDVFSCKPFNTDLALAHAVDTFESLDPWHQVTQRGLRFPRKT